VVSYLAVDPGSLLEPLALEARRAAGSGSLAGLSRSAIVSTLRQPGGMAKPVDVECFRRHRVREKTPKPEELRKFRMARLLSTL